MNDERQVQRRMLTSSTTATKHHYHHAPITLPLKTLLLLTVKLVCAGS
jgi:hypothetical protein